MLKFKGSFNNGFIFYIVNWSDKIAIKVAYAAECLLISSTLGRSTIVSLQVVGAFVLSMMNTPEST